MHYAFVQTEERGWRVTTRAYRYRLARTGFDVFRIHWHPVGVSRYTLPHVHLSLCGRDGERLTTLGEHLPTGRLTFEDAVEWAIEAGVPPARPDWRKVLAEGRTTHIQHRSWDTIPPEP